MDIFIANTRFQESILVRRQKHTFDGITAFFASAEDILLLKLISNRRKDWVDIGDILLVHGEIDEPYMQHWADKLGVREQYEQMLAERIESALPKES